ncbi:hypothetical protein KC963_04230 [Candidatus Saccharibacteria bacterium]|nr:hypothetical protein [Candidatus Saccharibacteria bacterium]
MSEKRVGKWGKVLITLLLLPAAVIVPALSLESHYAPSIQAQTQPDSAQAQRVADYKAGLGREVPLSEQNRIKLRCAVAQGNAKTLASRLSEVRTKRAEAYDSIMKSLNELAVKLENQAFETSALQENIDTLQTKMDTFKVNMGNYYIVVNDLATVDCANDPAAFVATLDAARKANAAVQPQLADIRGYITNTVKPTLAGIRQQIEDGQTVGGS